MQKRKRKRETITFNKEEAKRNILYIRFLLPELVEALGGALLLETDGIFPSSRPEDGKAVSLVAERASTISTSSETKAYGSHGPNKFSKLSTRLAFK